MTPRFHQLTYAELNPDGAALADEILKVSSAGIGGPYNVLLRSPEMAKRSSDPHQIRTGNLEFRQILTEVFRLCGHVPTGPRGVFDQSSFRTSVPIFPPPESASSHVDS